MRQNHTIAAPRDCRYMAAMGLEVHEGRIRSIADRETIINRLKEMMRLSEDLYKKGKTAEVLANIRDPKTKAQIDQIKDEFTPENDPVRAAIQDGFALFRTIANEIFAEDPPLCSVTALPAETFADVPFFYDIGLIAEEVGYDLSVFGSPDSVEGENSERSVNYNRERRGGVSGGASGNMQPKQSATVVVEDVLEGLGDKVLGADKKRRHQPAEAAKPISDDDDIPLF